MIKQSWDNSMLYSQVAPDSKMIDINLFSSYDDQVQRCLDLLINYILHFPVILHSVARDSSFSEFLVATWPLGRVQHALPLYLNPLVP